MDVCLLWVLCVVRKRSLRRPDHSSRGVLPTVLRRCVWSRKPQEWGRHDPRWVAAPQQKKSQLYMFRATFSPIIRSTWLYLQYLAVFTQVAACWCLGWVETHPRHQQAATWVNTTRYCKYSRAPDDGRKHRPKHVQLTRNNKLTYIVKSCSPPKVSLLWRSGRACVVTWSWELCWW